MKTRLFSEKDNRIDERWAKSDFLSFIFSQLQSSLWSCPEFIMGFQTGFFSFFAVFTAKTIWRIFSSRVVRCTHTHTFNETIFCGQRQGEKLVLCCFFKRISPLKVSIGFCSGVCEIQEQIPKTCAVRFGDYCRERDKMRWTLSPPPYLVWRLWGKNFFFLKGWRHQTNYCSTERPKKRPDKRPDNRFHPDSEIVGLWNYQMNRVQVNKHWGRPTSQQSEVTEYLQENSQIK